MCQCEKLTAGSDVLVRATLDSVFRPKNQACGKGELWFGYTRAGYFIIDTSDIVKIVKTKRRMGDIVWGNNGELHIVTEDEELTGAMDKRRLVCEVEDRSDLN